MWVTAQEVWKLGKSDRDGRTWKNGMGADFGFECQVHFLPQGSGASWEASQHRSDMTSTGFGEYTIVMANGMDGTEEAEGCHHSVLERGGLSRWPLTQEGDGGDTGVGQGILLCVSSSGQSLGFTDS